jgi:hypothetical protein
MAALAMFASSSEEGLRLARAVEALAREYGLEPRIVRPEPGLFFEAIFTAQVVVIDGSLEQENVELYRAASVVLSPFDHVLVVGRTYLPLNFVAQRKGGAPPYPYPFTTLADGSPIPYLTPLAWRSNPLVDWENDPVDEWIAANEMQDDPAGEWSNEAILRWLRIQIPDALTDPGPRLDPPQLKEMLASGDSFVMRPIYDHALQKIRRERKAAFISYRGRDFGKALRLGRKIREGFHEPPKPAIVIKPGALALQTEMLTEVRRWMIMGLLDDELRRSDELWIVESADYRGSWWTTAELYAAEYVAETPGERLRIRIWNPETGEVRDGEMPEYRIDLSDAHRKRMARVLSNTRPDQLSPESRVAMRMLRWGYRLGLGWLVNRKMKSFSEQHQPMLQNSLPEKLANDVDISPILQKNAMREYVNDRVFRDEFWDDLYIEPQRIGGSVADYRPSPEAFINSPEKEMIRIPGAEAAAAVARGRRAVGKIGKTKYELTLVSGPPRYFWRPVRVGIPGDLIPVPTYLVVR